jgi:hypothetical protein
MIAYRQPASGSFATWTPADTPVMDGTGSNLEISSVHGISSDGDEAPAAPAGFVYLNGLTYSQRETHLDHRNSTNELIRFNGAELAYKIHTCDYVWFSYDPEVRCTGFIVTDGGTQVVSYREVR